MSEMHTMHLMNELRRMWQAAQPVSLRSARPIRQRTFNMTCPTRTNAATTSPSGETEFWDVAMELDSQLAALAPGMSAAAFKLSKAACVLRMQLTQMRLALPCSVRNMGACTQLCSAL